MKHYSSETMRIHAQDLTKELEVKQIEDALRYFMINVTDGKVALPMHSLAARQQREWASIGVLDLHDLAQECYCALIKSYSRVKWDVINASSNPKASLWAFLKKSIKLDTRKAINTFKDGMRVPNHKIWEAKTDKHSFDLDNFFSIPMPNMWFWEKDEELGLIDDCKMSTWETEELYYALDLVMRRDLSQIERQVIEMGFGIEQPHEEKRSYKYMADYFNITTTAIKKIKARALKKLNIEDNKEYLSNFIEN